MTPKPHADGKVKQETKGVNMSDSVNHPPHYNRGKIEVIDFIEDQRFDFNAGNVVKYVSRYALKGGQEDLKKARFYLDRLIEQQKESKPATPAAPSAQAVASLPIKTGSPTEPKPQLYVRLLNQVDVEKVMDETETHYVIHRPTSYSDYRPASEKREGWPKENCVVYQSAQQARKDGYKP